MKCSVMKGGVMWFNRLQRISFYRTDNYRQWNAVGSPDDGHKDARNMLR